MTVVVMCDLCIECERLQLTKGDIDGICQQSGEWRKSLDVGRCIGRARRSEGEVRRIMSDYIDKHYPKSIITGVYSADIHSFIPISKDGKLGYNIPLTKKTDSGNREVIPIDE